MNAVLNKVTKVIDLGLIDYKEAWDYQEDLFRKSVDTKVANRKRADDEQEDVPNYLIFCQHPHVYTLGKSGSNNNLLVNERELHDIDASYYKINRGGDITYHGPGQIVCYPILDLDNFFTDIHKYLRYLEEAVIMTCQHYGVSADRVDGLTGVWVDHQTPNPRKICAIGVRSSRWVTMHGLAMNVSTDLNYFGNIVPCGIDDKAVTSLEKEIGRKPEIKEVQNILKSHIGQLFKMELNEK